MGGRGLQIKGVHTSMWQHIIPELVEEDYKLKGFTPPRKQYLERVVGRGLEKNQSHDWFFVYKTYLLICL
jgi:hypothetical protein